MEETFIYALCEPGTRDIRYIGKSNNPRQRLHAHLFVSSKGNNHFGAWLRKLRVSGCRPDLLILKKIPKDGWEWWEKSFIRNARIIGFDLTNFLEGGDSLPDVSGESNPMFGKHHTEETKRKIGLANKGNRTIGFTGRKQSDFQKQKASLVHKGNKHNLGKRRSEEDRRKMSMDRKHRNEAKRCFAMLEEMWS